MDKRTKEYKNRKATKDALLMALELSNLREKYFLDMAEEYMNYYDDMVALNKKIRAVIPLDTGEVQTIIDTDMLREKRQVAREMRSILNFLGLKPTAEVGGYEEL